MCALPSRCFQTGAFLSDPTAVSRPRSSQQQSSSTPMKALTRHISRSYYTCNVTCTAGLAGSGWRGSRQAPPRAFDVRMSGVQCACAPGCPDWPRWGRATIMHFNSSSKSALPFRPSDITSDMLKKLKERKWKRHTLNLLLLCHTQSRMRWGQKHAMQREASL